MPIAPPTKFVDAFAHSAGPDFINTIPETTSTPGVASMAQGFPPVTFQSPAAGGVPPFGQDVNGILNQTTAGVAFLEAGQIFPFDGGYAAAIGGYATGARVLSADGLGFWVSQVNGNTLDPDTTTSPQFWLAVDFAGFATVDLSGQSSVALTTAQWRYGKLNFVGTLTQNCQVLFPQIPREWLIMNNATGAFTVTIATAGGVVQTVPAGGPNSPYQAYCDGTNMRPAVAPLSVPIDQAPTPSTLVERTNAGYVLATYLNQNSGLENVTADAVFVESSGDGFLRKLDPATLLSQFAGISAGNGSCSLPGGFYLKWGTTAGSNTAQTVTFASPFPSVCYGVVATNQSTSGAFVATRSYSAANFVLQNGLSAGSTFWIAIGR